MGNITHSFVSTLPDGSNPALVDKTPWNAPHVVDATGVLVGDGVNAITGVAGARAGQYLIQKYYATPTQYEFRDLPDLIVTEFNFPAIAPVSNLVAGVPAIIPIPTTIIGIQAVSAGLHQLRIVNSANPLLTEVVLLTAGTTLGSLYFTPANSHTAGQYTITSATSGLQECIAYAHSLGGAKCFMPVGTYTAYANTNLTLAANVSLKLYGVSPSWSMIARHSSYPSGNILTYAGAGRGNGSLVLEDFRILGANGFHNSAGYGVGIAQVDNSRLFFNRVWVFDGNGGFLLQDAPNVHMSFCQYYESPQQVMAGYAAAEAGLRLVGTQSDLNFVSCTFQTGYRGVLTNMLGAGIYINGCDGAQFVNCVSAGYYGTRLFATGSIAILNLWMLNHISDECRWAALQIEGTTTNFYANLNFIKMHLNCQIPYPGSSPIVITGNCDYVTISLSNGNLGATDAVTVQTGTAYHGGATQSILISDCDFSANGLANLPGTVGIRIGANSSGVKIRNCSVSKRPMFTSDLTAGIAFDGAASHCSVVGTELRDYTSSPIFIGGTLTNCLIEANPGVDNVIPTVASAATLACPVNPNFKVSGTTGVTAVTGMWAGRRGQLVTTGGAVTFTAGASIANTVTTTQNRPINYFFDGTLLYLG